VEGAYSNHALFLIGDEEVTDVGIVLADDGAGRWAARPVALSRVIDS
jgi:hypothetical protein